MFVSLFLRLDIRKIMSIKVVRKKRRSLVRFLASCVPNFLWEYFFPVPPRMYISSSLIQKIAAMGQNNYASDDSSTSFYSFKENFLNRNQQEMMYSTPKKVADVEDAKLKALQQELDEVKKMVAKLMEKQTEQCSGYGTLSNRSDQCQKSFQPPPPPPPLPPANFSLLPVCSPLKIEKKKNVTPTVPQNGFPCGKELLRDLKKVQLKKIEKSPGGGPLKKPNKVTNDPGDILAAVLKKRFGCVQNSPETSFESGSIENSFGSGTINNSYGIEKKMKISVM